MTSTIPADVGTAGTVVSEVYAWARTLEFPRKPPYSSSQAITNFPDVGSIETDGFCWSMPAAGVSTTNEAPRGVPVGPNCRASMSSELAENWFSVSQAMTKFPALSMEISSLFCTKDDVLGSTAAADPIACQFAS